MLERILFVAACLFLPVAWGVIVNRVFDFWHERNGQKTDEDEPIFPDYQI